MTRDQERSTDRVSRRKFLLSSAAVGAAGVDCVIEGDRAVCPLCGVATADARKLYVHLQTGHRKSTLAGLVPSPGGLAGVEFALAGLLIGLVGLARADAYAVALVYRIASYWFALLLGGGAALYVIRRI